MYQHCKICYSAHRYQRQRYNETTPIDVLVGMSRQLAHSMINWGEFKERWFPVPLFPSSFAIQPFQGSITCSNLTTNIQMKSILQKKKYIVTHRLEVRILKILCINLWNFTSASLLLRPFSDRTFPTDTSEGWGGHWA